MSAQPTTSTRLADQPLRPITVGPIPSWAPEPLEGPLEVVTAARRAALRPAPWPRQGMLDLVPASPRASVMERQRALMPDPDEDDIAPRPTSTHLLPDPATWAGPITLALLEVAAGRRPAAQVLRFTSPQVFSSLTRRQQRALARPTPLRLGQRIRRVHVCHPRDGVAEVSVIISDGERVKAIALRLLGLDHRWVVDAFEVG